MLKRTMLIGYIMLMIFTGIAYAAGANRLDIYGIAYVSNFSLDSLPVFPLVNPDGSYFHSANLPASLTHGDEAWIGDTFYLNIVKPPSVSNNGQNQFTMIFNVLNPTNYVWTAGLATVTIESGIYSTVGATLSATTVNPDQSIAITFSFKTKIDINSYDKARIDVSYIVGGVRRHIYIDIIMRPIGSAMQNQLEEPIQIEDSSEELEIDMSLDYYFELEPEFPED